MFVASQVVLAEVAVEEKVITALGTGRLYVVPFAIKLMLAFVTYSLTLPVFGSPFTVRPVLLNQMEPEPIEASEVG